MRRKKNKNYKSTRRRRGIYILPNIFTTLNAFCGFYAIISALNGKFEIAAISLIVAAIFDLLDGKIARATKTTSKFGVEYDSLADLTSFGLSTAVVMYLWSLMPLGRIGWLAAFLFAICGALRLARFNTQVGSTSGDYFTGLPIPAASGMNATTILFFDRFGIAGTDLSLLVLIMTYCLSFLMVSTIPYKSFKTPEFYRKIKFNILVAAVLVLIFIAALPSVALFFLLLAYVLSGPVVFFRGAWSKKKQGEKGAEEIEIEKENSNPVNL